MLAAGSAGFVSVGRALFADAYWATVPQRKTGRPVQFELTEQTRDAVMRWTSQGGRKPGDYLVPSRFGGGRKPITTRHYARLMDGWMEAIGFDPGLYGTHPLRRTKAALIYRRTGNLRAVQLLLGHTKIEGTVRYLGVEVDDALAISEGVDVSAIPSRAAAIGRPRPGAVVSARVKRPGIRPRTLVHRVAHTVAHEAGEARDRIRSGAPLVARQIPLDAAALARITLVLTGTRRCRPEKVYMRGGRRRRAGFETFDRRRQVRLIALCPGLPTPLLEPGCGGLGRAGSVNLGGYGGLLTTPAALAGEGRGSDCGGALAASRPARL